MAPSAQGSDRLHGRSASCRVPSVPEPPPRLGARGATNLPGPVLLCVPRFSPRERRPQHAPRRSRLTRSSSPEAEAWAPPGLAPPLSRDLAHVTARRHLGLWPGHKSPRRWLAPFLEARLPRERGSDLASPSRPCGAGVRVARSEGRPRVASLPGSKMDGSGDGGGLLWGKHVACRWPAPGAAGMVAESGGLQPPSGREAGGGGAAAAPERRPGGGPASSFLAQPDSPCSRPASPWPRFPSCWSSRMRTAAR